MCGVYVCVCGVCVHIVCVCCPQTHGHSEDILSVAVDVSNLMATSSFDGEVFISYSVDISSLMVI